MCKIVIFFFLHAQQPECPSEPCKNGKKRDANCNCPCDIPIKIDPAVPIQCGVHNPNGIRGPGGITIRQFGASSQEGEWPHACLLFNGNRAIGGASLINPQVLVTAAHLLE